MNEVSFPSMSRYVIFESFLKPLAQSILREASKQIPKLTDYDADFDSKDPRQAAIQKFDAESAHIAESSLVDEARSLITDSLDMQWDQMKQVNEAMGDQTQETRTETKEILGAIKKVPVGG